MFETFAILSTISCIVIFVVLYRIDQAGRREEAEQSDPQAWSEGLTAMGSPAPLDDVLRFMRLIWAIDHELERVSKRMEARIGLTVPQRLAMLLIARSPGILASELAEALHLHRGTLSGIVRRLDGRRLRRAHGRPGRTAAAPG